MKSKFSQYMLHAIELAKRSTMEQRHATVIINPKCRDNPIVATGVNEHLHNQENRDVFSIHSEQMAISSLLALKRYQPHFMKNCIAFVARVGPQSLGYPVRFSKPCPMCEQLLLKVGIRRVFYTVDDDHMAELIVHDM